MPLKDLSKFKETVYYSFYNFEKNMYPEKKIFRYIESNITNNEFMVFYNLVYPTNNLNSLKATFFIYILIGPSLTIGLNSILEFFFKFT